MRHVRMLGLCLAAASAVGACAASSALAAGPEWGKCVAKAGGKYTNATCQTKGKGGSYEWEKGAKINAVPFSGESVGSGGVLYGAVEECRARYPEAGGGKTFDGRFTRKACAEKTYENEAHAGEPVHGERVEDSEVKIACESERNTGEGYGSRYVRNISVVFKGCKLFGSLPCSNSVHEGEIVVNALKGELGYINKRENKAGVLLTPVAKRGEFAKFDCNGTLEVVVGVGNKKEGAYYEPESKGGNDGIISPITPVNQMSSRFEQVFTVANEGGKPVNVPSKFEGKPTEALETYTYVTERPEEGSMWSPAGEEITNVNNASEEVEIKA